MSTNDDWTTATRPERRRWPDFLVGHTQARHGEPSSVSLAAGPLVGLVQALVNLLWKVPGLSGQNRESRRLRSSSSRSPIFVVDDFSLPPLRTNTTSRTPARLRGTLYPRTYVLSLITDCSENNLKHTFPVWRLTSIDDVMHLPMFYYSNRRTVSFTSLWLSRCTYARTTLKIVAFSASQETGGGGYRDYRRRGS